MGFWGGVLLLEKKNKSGFSLFLVNFLDDNNHVEAISLRFRKKRTSK
jgi:hypothetical protein